MRLRTTVLLLTFALLCAGCAYGNYFLPDKSLNYSPIPDKFRSTVGDGWYHYQLKPASSINDSVSQNMIDDRWYGSVRHPRATNRVLAARGKYLWFVPRAKGLSGKSGVVQIDTETHEARLLGEFSVDLPSDRVNRVKARNDGTVWIGTNSGAMNFDPQLGRGTTFDDWMTFDQRGGGLERDYLLFSTTPSVLDIDESGHTILFATGDLFAFDQKKVRWRRFDETYDAHQTDHREDRRRYRKKVSYTITTRDGKKKTRRVTLEIIEIREYVDYQMRSRGKRDIVSDTIFEVLGTAEDIWMLTQQGISQYNIPSKTYRSHIKQHSLWRESESCEDYHDPSDTCVRKIYRRERYDYPGTAPLLDVAASCAAADERGRVWFGFGGTIDSMGRSRGGAGLMYFSNGRWQQVDSGPVSGKRVTDLLSYKQRLFVATTQGVFVRRDNGSSASWEQIRIDKNRSFSDVLDIELDDRGVLWVATPEGVFGKRVIQGPIDWPKPGETIRMPGF
ncbi:MAG: hypothetical protein P9M14_15290 [Candidatus Alcyoniella australis]|nr:hypothetical protein [Candidatus Alcyoniella australis]